MPMAQLIWIDPGSTTGVCIVGIDVDWLKGKGEPGFGGLGAAIKFVWHAQIGRDPKIWEDARASVPKGLVIPATGNDRRSFEGVRPGSLEDILAMEGEFGGGPLTTSQADEVSQVVQLQSLLNQWPDAAWGYEDFIPDQVNFDRDFLAPVRIFTSLTMSEIVYGSRARIPFAQSRSFGKTPSNDPRLKRAKLYRPGMPHATDAARHAATFLRRARADKDLRVAAWPHLDWSE